MKSTSYFNLITRLNSLRSYHTRTRLYNGSLIVLSVIFTYLLFSFILSYLSGFILSVFIRVALLGIFFLALSIAFSYYFLRPLFYKPPLEDLAVKIETQFPKLKDRLIGALQLYRNLEKNPEGYSVQMIEAIIEQADTVSMELDFRLVVDKKPLRKTLQICSGLLGLVLIFTFLSPGNFNRSLYLFSHPLTSVQSSQKFFFSISPGNAEVVKYSDVRIEITAEGQKPSKVDFYWRDGEGAWNQEKLEKLDRSGAKGQLQDTAGTVGGHDFEYLFKQVKRDIDYYAKAEGIKSEQYKLKVTDKPRITNLKLTLNYPKYTQLKPLVLDQNDGTIEALAGTRVKIEASANKELSVGNLIFSDSTKSQMKIDGKKATGKILVRKDQIYHLEVADKSGNKNPDPIEYKITRKDDLFPQVEILQPGEDRDLTENMQLQLRIHGNDDFGFTGLRLVYQIPSKEEQTKTIKLPYEEKLQGELGSDYTWDLSNIGLMPGDNVKYWVEIYDNDNFSGPKKGVSQSYNLRHPTLAEIVGEIEQGSENQLADLQKKLDEQKELQKKLDQLSKDLLTESTNPQEKESKISWEKKNDLDNLLQKQNDLAESLKKLSQEAGKTADKIEQNNLASLELLEKIAEMKKLFEEVAPPELKEAMEKLQEALNTLDKDKIKEAIQNLNLSTEELLKRLDKTIAMLKQMRIEQRMEDLVKLTQRLAQNQENLNKEIEKAKKEELSSLKDKQENLKKETEGLENKLQELNELMKDTPLLSSEDMDTLVSSVEKSGVKNDMQNTSQSLQQGQKSESLKSGKTCSNKLSNLSQKYQSMLEKMKQGDKEQILADMRKSLQDILYLSDSQESLFEDTKTFQPREAGLANLAAEQQRLMEGLNQVGKDLNELAKKTFYINADLAMQLSLASINMLQSIGRLEELDGNRSLSYQFESLFDLNQAAKSLLEGVQDAQKSCPNPDVFSKLQGMCQNQGSINEQTLDLSDQGMFSMEQQAELARLAAEQQALKENLERLNQESGNRSQILGNLDDIAKDMQKVVEDLQRMKVDQSTIDRQKQILSRLLDSEKSLVKKDYSEKRKAETGEDIARKSPVQLPPDIGALDQKEKERAQRLSSETYPKEYEEAIKEYFKALSEPEKK
ncbi:MAG TPA: DUF4175 family protein [Terriglobales bacterium]|nr:DUF4175 family protein [Terriglobales bacterium]